MKKFLIYGMYSGIALAILSGCGSSSSTKDVLPEATGKLDDNISKQFLTGIYFTKLDPKYILPDTQEQRIIKNNRVIAQGDDNSGTEECEAGGRIDYKLISGELPKKDDSSKGEFKYEMKYIDCVEDENGPKQNGKLVVSGKWANTPTSNSKDETYKNEGDFKLEKGNQKIVVSSWENKKTYKFEHDGDNQSNFTESKKKVRTYTAKQYKDNKVTIEFKNIKRVKETEYKNEDGNSTNTKTVNYSGAFDDKELTKGWVVFTTNPDIKYKDSNNCPYQGKIELKGKEKSAYIEFKENEVEFSFDGKKEETNLCSSYN